MLDHSIVNLSLRHKYEYVYNPYLIQKVDKIVKNKSSSSRLIQKFIDVTQFAEGREYMRRMYYSVTKDGKEELRERFEWLAGT
jgi:hypothetical protein